MRWIMNHEHQPQRTGEKLRTNPQGIDPLDPGDVGAHEFCVAATQTWVRMNHNSYNITTSLRRHMNDGEYVYIYD